MLKNIHKMFDYMPDMLKKLKKKNYEKNMNDFIERNDHYFLEMTGYTEQADDHYAAAKEVAEQFVNGVKTAFEAKGRIKPRMQADMNFFMIYYVFPALLLTQCEYADAIAEEICSLWGSVFKESNIGYANYDTIHDGFREKILGIF